MTASAPPPDPDAVLVLPEPDLEIALVRALQSVTDAVGGVYVSGRDDGTVSLLVDRDDAVHRVLLALALGLMAHETHQLVAMRFIERPLERQASRRKLLSNPPARRAAIAVGIVGRFRE